MTKEEILRAFLSDDLFIEKGYLKPNEAATFKWSPGTNNNLIEVLKIAIDGEVANESANIVERKINSHLNKVQ
ncbi:MAG TPA: hypothetical protein VGD22_15150 [Sphingobacteriaceae bacterium]